MQRTHRLFFLLGLILLFSVFFVFLLYIKKYKPFFPKPPVADYRIPASDSLSFANCLLYDFENFNKPDLLSTTQSFSGKYSIRVKGKKEYSLLIQKPFSELQRKDITEAAVSAWIQTGSGNKLNGKLMFQIVDKSNSLKYSYAVNLVDVLPEGSSWFYISGKAVFDDYKPGPGDIAKVYYWNDCPFEVFIDDIRLVFGKQQIKGSKPFIDETDSHYSYQAKDNQPPYSTLYTMQLPVVNQKNASILSTDGKGALTIEENDSFLKGNFIPGNKGLDQILLIRNHLPFAFVWFVPEKFAFSYSLIDPETFPLDLTMIQLCAADVNGDGTDEMLYISGNPQDIKVYAYTALSKKLKLLSVEKSQIQNGIGEIQKIKIRGKRSESLFATDVTGAAFLLSFEKNLWITTPLGTISEASQENFDCRIVSGNFLNSEGNDNILLLYRERKSRKCFYKLFAVDAVAVKNTCIQKGNFDNKPDTLYPENNYFAGDFDGDSISELISYDSRWRFDLKLIRFSEKSYHIMGNIDFRGYETDHNPKYYENLILAAGHFADKSSCSFIVACKNHKVVPGLPESLGIYWYLSIYPEMPK